MNKTVTLRMNDQQWNRLLEAAEGWSYLGDESQGVIIRSDEMKSAFEILDAAVDVASDDDKPITVEWLNAELIPSEIALARHSRLLISGLVSIAVAADSRSLNEDQRREHRLNLPHITTRGQLRQLIGLLAPDLKVIHEL